LFSESLRLSFCSPCLCGWQTMLANGTISWRAFVLGAFMFIILVCYCVFLKDWIGSEYKATVLNREYGASYTREEIFYASDVIDTIRQLDRTRMEINGDLMKKE